MCQPLRSCILTMLALTVACGPPRLGGISLEVPVYTRHEEPPCPFEVIDELALINTYTGLPPEEAERQKRWEGQQEREIREMLKETQADAIFQRSGGGPLTPTADSLQFIRWTEPRCPG